MIDCGFVTSDIIYATTSINTVDFVRVSDAICFMQLTSVSNTLLLVLNYSDSVSNVLYFILI